MEARSPSAQVFPQERQLRGHLAPWAQGRARAHGASARCWSFIWELPPALAPHEFPSPWPQRTGQPPDFLSPSLTSALLAGVPLLKPVYTRTPNHVSPCMPY